MSVSCGHPLKMTPAFFGELKDSAALLGNTEALRRGMEEDGYLFIRGMLDPSLIREARKSLVAKLEQRGLLEEGGDPDAGLLRAEVDLSFLPEIAQKDEAVRRVVFGPEMKAFYGNFLGGPVRHFDFIWLRAMGLGKGTRPHCDLVYMGRGTHRLYTAWIPYGPVSRELGGLMVLERSHLQAGRIRNYLSSDVDSFCSNQPERQGWKKLGGALSTNPVSLQEKLGGRWLTTEYGVGDFITFRMDLIHGSTDNQTRQVRLSSDTRYQRFDEPVDERWIGDEPIGHGQAGKRGRIC